MTIKDPELRAHQEWLGYVQPVGLVVSAHALHRAQAFVAKGLLPEHARFLSLVKEVPVAGKDEPVRAITDIDALVTTVFGWESRDLVGALGGEPLPDDLKVPLNEYGETLSPTYAVADPEPQGDGTARWQMLIQKLELAKPLDEPLTKDDLRWQASPQSRLERLLRETGVSAGLLTNGIEFRLVYSPRGESSGHATFRVDQMCEIAGRPIFAAMQMLLGAERLFTLPRKQRLPYILSESRKYQNEVSTALAEQVLHALYEMLRGFQRANDESKGVLLRDVLREDPNHVYNGLLTVLLRLIFVLYAEERGLLSSDPVYVNHYSVLGLFERLRADNDRNQDTMDHRYGAWAQLLTLFRLIHDGGSHGSLRLPPRHGHLFNPDRFNFLEGRLWRIGRVMGDRIEPPAISDGVIHRVLSKLLLLDGERISYRSLDVEQIGSVYEVMMGFTLDIASGTSIAIKPKKPLGAPSIVNLEALLAVTGKERAKRLRDLTDQEFTGEALTPLTKAITIDELAAALAKRVAREATPTPLPKGSMVLQSSESRRRSGSNYTPRSLTEPIVNKTLASILRALGENPTPEQLLGLKICDPAMGSGAFLVESCRQLADELVKAWHAHARLPKVPPDEDEVLHARRLVAQMCLYGVDRNPIAADLAKLSLWLATLAKDHPFTFLDHALRCGDSLVGLNRAQIEGFHWQPTKQLELVQAAITARMREALEVRAQIHAGGDEGGYDERHALLRDADAALDDVRLVGDLVLCAFFAPGSARDRERLRTELSADIDTFLTTRENFNALRSRVDEFRSRGDGTVPFHWTIEFPEVFERKNAGFDAFVGNPPFLGGSRISEVEAGPIYQQWLKMAVAPSKGQVDLCVFFVRRAFSLLRNGGALGLLATGSIAYGDNRVGGLAQIVADGGILLSAATGIPWPGEAAVVVAIVHIGRGGGTYFPPPYMLNRAVCNVINSRLQPSAELSEPRALRANDGLAHIGTSMGSSGFVLSKEEAVQLMGNPHNREVILSLTGGEEVNAPPAAHDSRYVICFGSRSLKEAEQWPELLAIVRDRVLPQRMKGKDHGPGNHGKKYWWQHILRADPLYRAIAGLDRCLITSRVSTHHAVRFEVTGRIFNEKVFAFAFDDYSSFAVLQSSLHSMWSLEHSSRHGTVVNYSVSSTFATFPFPTAWKLCPALVAAGQAYHDYRSAVMAEWGIGLTALYNRYHDSERRDPEMSRLRELHATVDRVVLDAYGWSDIAVSYQSIPESTQADDDGNEVPTTMRLRWPDEIRDKVLARLLALNANRAEEERLLGATAEPSPKPKRIPRKKGSGPSSSLYSD